jgi:myo-inositol-1(or 4)-monophosphatase
LRPISFLNFATALAREAGALLRAGYAQPKHIHHKGLTDLVTDYDHRAEALIVERIRAAHPDHALWAEESGRSGQHAYEWLIDPLDGTTNFAHGFPVFAVSLALTQHGQVIVGVVYDPLRDELFAAEAGRGATLNAQPIRVSTQDQLDHALLATGFPYDIRTNPRNNFAEFHALHLKAQAIRRAGSAALDCAWVAAGRLEGYWEFGIKAWDIGAGALLVREAGGRVTTVTGEENFLGRGSLLASNGWLHPALTEALKAARF